MTDEAGVKCLEIPTSRTERKNFGMVEYTEKFFFLLFSYNFEEENKEKLTPKEFVSSFVGGLFHRA